MQFAMQFAILRDITSYMHAVWSCEHMHILVACIYENTYELKN